MALIVKDRVRETTTTTGTGTLTLIAPVTGFQSFSVIGNGNTTYYSIVDVATGAWEVGIGTYTSSGTTLSRDTVLESSTGGAKISFSSGTKDVFCTYPAERSVSQADVGTDPNEIPLNQYLGSMAYQNSESAIIESGRIDLKGGGSNLVLYSQEFDQTNWSKGAVTVTVNSTVAPDGTTTADTVTPTATTATHQISSNTSIAGIGINTLSFYAKANGYSYIQLMWGSGTDYANFFLSSSGSVSQNSGGSPTITDVGNGWYRCSITSTLSVASAIYALPIQTGTEARFASTTGNGTSGVFIWGAQLEKSSALGNYIATTTLAIPLENAPGATALSVIPTTGFNTTYPMAFELVSNTSLVVKVKGSDGTVRSATLTLA